MKRSPSRHQRGFILLPVVLTLALLATLAFLLNRKSGMGVELASSEARSTEAQYVAEAGLHHVDWQDQNSGCTGYTNLSGVSFGSGTYDVAVAPTQGSPVTLTSTATLADGTVRTLTRSAAVVYEAPTAVTLQLGTDPGEDAMLDSSFEDRNHGSGYSAVSTNTWQRRRQLVRFDLSGIPAGVTVRSATLEQYAYSVSTASAGAAVAVHRVTRAWVEGTKMGGGIADGATWQTHDGVADWTAAGGDFDPDPVASAPIARVSGVWVVWPVDSLVQGWVSGTYANNGVLLKAAGNLWMEFYSKESNPGTEALRPKLTVAYACECGVDCAPAPPTTCDADYTPTALVGEFSTAAYPQRLNRGITFFPEGQALNGTVSPAGGCWVAVGGSGILWMVGMDGTELEGGYATGLSQLEGVAFVPAVNPSDPGHLVIVEGTSLYASDMALPANTSYTQHSLSFVSSAGGITYIDGGTYDGDLAIADKGSALIHIVDQSFNLVTTLATGGILSVPEGIAHLKSTDKFLVVDTGLSAILVIDAGLVVSQNYDLTPFSLGAPTGASAAIRPETCDHVIGDRPNNRFAYLNAGGLRMLFVVGDPAGLSPQETSRQALMGGWGFAVTLLDDSDTQANFDAATAAADVVYVSPSVVGGVLLDKLTGTTASVVNEFPGKLDNFGFSSGTTQTVSGDTFSTTEPTHYITEPFGGNPVIIFNSPLSMPVPSATLAPDLSLLAEVSLTPALVALEAGAQRWDGTPAPARRVHLPFAPAGFADLTADGQTLMRRAIEWAADAGGGGTPPPTGGPLTLSPVADAAIYQASPDTNYGTQETMRVGEDSSGQKYRSLVRFDVSGVPADATVSSATLRTYIVASTGNQTNPVGIYRLTGAWEETAVTWNSSGGGTFDPTQLAVSDIPRNFTGWVEWSIPTGLIHEWVDGVAPNHGLLLNYEASFNGNFRSPATRENAAADQRPQLVIEYLTLIVLPPPEPVPL